MATAHDKYYNPIEGMLQKNGPMGVNAIARELDVPVSTIQKWLERQDYFVKNANRKWQLPEKSEQIEQSKSSHGLTGELDPVIEAQIRSISRLHEMLVTQLKNTVDFITEYEIKGPPQVVIEETEPPVADLDPRLIQLETDAKKLIEIFNKRDIKANIPEEFRALLNGYDHIGLIIKEGKDFATKFLEDEIFSLLSGRISTLSEETVGILKENQK